MHRGGGEVGGQRENVSSDIMLCCISVLHIAIFTARSSVIRDAAPDDGLLAAIFLNLYDLYSPRFLGFIYSFDLQKAFYIVIPWPYLDATLLSLYLDTVARHRYCVTSSTLTSDLKSRCAETSNKAFTIYGMITGEAEAGLRTLLTNRVYLIRHKNW